MSEHAPVFAITGGPRSGKTTCLCYLEEKLRDRGYAVFIVPEAATELIHAGIKPDDGQFTLEEFEEIIVRRILETEALFKKAASISRRQKKIIICDRGIMDTRAYMRESFFKNILAKFGLTSVTARDELYDAVFHLRSSAFGDESLYVKEDNPARRENSAEAREADARTLRAWLGHPHLRVIETTPGFDAKLKKLDREICAALGVPVPLEIERKFLVHWQMNVNAIPVPFEEILIEQAYLPAPDGEALRIRKRSQNGSAVYYHTHKRRFQAGGDGGAFRSVEVERHISDEEYRELFLRRNQNLRVIKKKRYCFVWENQYFELDFFIEPYPLLKILEIELTEARDALLLPPFIPIEKELAHLTNEQIARSGELVLA